MDKAEKNFWNAVGQKTFALLREVDETYDDATSKLNIERNAKGYELEPHDKKFNPYTVAGKGLFLG